MNDEIEFQALDPTPDHYTYKTQQVTFRNNSQWLFKQEYPAWDEDGTLTPIESSINESLILTSLLETLL